MRFPIRMSMKVLNPFSSDLRGEQRPKAIPPKSHSLMTDFDPALMQQILHFPERKREPDLQHHRKADDVGTGLEIPKWAVFCHTEKPNRRPALHNRVSSDKTRARIERIFRMENRDGHGWWGCQASPNGSQFAAKTWNPNRRHAATAAARLAMWVAGDQLKRLLSIEESRRLNFEKRLVLYQIQNDNH